MTIDVVITGAGGERLVERADDLREALYAAQTAYGARAREVRLEISIDGGTQTVIVCDA